MENTLRGVPRQMALVMPAFSTMENRSILQRHDTSDDKKSPKCRETSKLRRNSCQGNELQRTFCILSNSNSLRIILMLSQSDFSDISLQRNYIYF